VLRAWEIPHRDEWKLGERVVVYYDPKEPSTSSLIDFADRADDDIGPMPLLFAGIVGFIGFIFYQRRRYARTKSAA
jgi:hypothetical protein